MPYGQPSYEGDGYEKPGDAYTLPDGGGFYAPVDNLIYGMTPEEWYALTPEEQKRAAAAFLMRPEYQRVEYGTPGGIQGFGPSRYREIDPQKYAMGQAMLDQLQNDEDREEEANRRRIRDQLLRDKQGYGGGSITGSGEDYSNPIYGPPMTNPGFNEEIAPRAADPNITDSEMAILAGGRLAMNKSEQGYVRKGGGEPQAVDQSDPVEQIKTMWERAAYYDAQAAALRQILLKSDENNPQFMVVAQQAEDLVNAAADLRKEAKKREAELLRDKPREAEEPYSDELIKRLQTPGPSAGSQVPGQVQGQAPGLQGIAEQLQNKRDGFRDRRLGAGTDSDLRFYRGGVGGALSVPPEPDTYTTLPPYVQRADGEIIPTATLSDEDKRIALLYLNKGIVTIYVPQPNDSFFESERNY